MNLRTADVGNLDTSAVTDFYQMFYGCSKLVGLDLSNWNTNRANTMGGMFYGCSELRTTGAPGLHIAPGTNTTLGGPMFYGCNKFIYCTDQGDHQWVGYTWNKHAADAGYSCVLELKSGTIPDHTGTDAATQVPWSGDSNITKLITDSGAALSPTGGRYLFANLPNLVSADVTHMDASQAQDVSSLFWNDPKLETVTGTAAWTWGMEAKLTTMANLFKACSKLTTIDLSGWETDKAQDMSHMFDGDANLTNIIGINDWTRGTTDTLTSIASMFNGCAKLTTALNLSGWKTGLVTDLSNMFDGDAALTTLDTTGWSIVSATTTANMFNGCANLSEITGINDWTRGTTDTLTSMANMFNGCTKLTNLDLSGWKTGLIINITGMFNSCANLTSLDLTGWDTSQVTNMAGLFQNLDKLPTIAGISSWNTSRVTNMASMFQGDAALVGEPDLPGETHPTPNGRTLNLSTWDTSNVTDMRFIFQSCTSLESLDISGWSTASLGSHDDMIDDDGHHMPNNSQMIEFCPKLYRVKLGPDIDFSMHRQSRFTSVCDQGSCWSGTDYAFSSPLHHRLDTNHPEWEYDPVYKNLDGTAYLRGAEYGNMTPGRFPNPEWIYLINTHYVDACSNGEAVPTTVMCPSASKEGYRLTGWKNGDNGKYKPGSTVPYAVPGNTLAPVWSPLVPPGVSKATPHADGSLTVGGGMPGGTLTGDKYTATPYAAASGGSPGTSADSATVTGLTASAPEDGTWTADYTNATNPYPADTIGNGTNVWFTSKLTQADNTTSGESGRKRLTVDTVAPGAEQVRIDAPSGATPGSRASVTGVTWTSGHSSTQTARAIEAGDRIVVTWPDGTKSGADNDGDPLPTIDPGSIVSGPNGYFAVDVPASQTLSGQATITVYDNADGDGTDPDHPAGVENKANHADITIKLTPPTVNKLPLTGHHWQADGVITFAAIAVLAATTGAYAQRKRQRH
ncbi:BspA family leucine-rich repeat surface protein [Bifidobacterium sp. ESL0790]|uniref:BspA family leucine-rich repeat surface protein n=1 Tax=Bifidobacterium sp. ESL0790 TaxID=2983233 RepID=UPI0023F8BB11|nr:BspA family leucine-rich repeat surface protein [Bifidobacterium sp. ESL0790]WEV72383.1 BspA family leucine-rich repeat surface protein [Bifidobacterium sp. ESL0790]